MEQNGTDLGSAIAALSRHRRLIVAAVIVTTLGALVYSYRGSQSYSASSRVVVRPVLVEGTITPEEVLDSDQDPYALSASIETQAELVLGEDVAARVAETIPAIVLERTVITARPVTDEILEIQTSASDPASAVQVANAYAAAYFATRQAMVRDAFLRAADELDRRIDALFDRAEELESARALVPDGSAEAISLAAELRSVAGQISELTTERDQRELDAQTVTGGGDVVSKARTASTSGPAPLRDAAVGAFLGLAVGGGLALLRTNSNRRVQTLDDAAEATGAEVLAAIPPASSWARRSSDVIHVRVLRDDESPHGVDEGVLGEIAEPGRVVLNGRDPASSGAMWFPPPIASSLSILRGLVIRELGLDGRRLVVLSPERDEGSALVTSGLAWAFASTGLTTIAVDAALGDGEPRPLFGLRGDVGLGEVISGRESVKDALLATSVTGLQFLPAGPGSGGHDDALAAARSVVFEVFEQPADMVVVRAPSMASGGDAIAWAEEAEATLLVLRAGVSRPGAAGRAALRLRTLNTPLMGVVLTDARPGDGSLGLPGHDGSSALRRVSLQAHPGVDELFHGDESDPSPVAIGSTRPSKRRRI